MRFALALLLVLFGGVYAASARAPETSVDVQVSDKNGKPVDHADVEVKLVKGSKPRTMWRARTGEDGIAHSPNQIPQGSLLVEVSAEGYQTVSQHIDVNQPRQTVQVTLTSGLTQINVHVMTPGGKPVDHADVVVKFVKGRSLLLLGKAIRTSWEMRTNQEGIAKVPEIPQGTVLIQVIASGYQTFGQTFDVTEPQKNIEIKLNSPQEQYTAH